MKNKIRELMTETKKLRKEQNIETYSLRGQICKKRKKNATKEINIRKLLTGMSKPKKYHKVKSIEKKN